MHVLMSLSEAHCFIHQHLFLPLSPSLVLSYRLHSMSVFSLSYLHSEAREDLLVFLSLSFVVFLYLSVSL